MQNIPPPILYSFRRCPYAMRARLGLMAADIKVELREVVLKNKPDHMLELSPKGTVPVLWLGGDNVIDESLNIALWALRQNDPLEFLTPQKGNLQNMLGLISENDGPFKHHLDRTKYAVRYPDEDPEDQREKANAFLSKLNDRLQKHTFLFGDRPGLADITIAPFVRQFANTDRERFGKEQGADLINWLEGFLNSELFQSVMNKYPAWSEGDIPTFFPNPGQKINNGSARNQARSA